MELRTTRRNGSVYKDRRLSDTVDLFKPHHALSVRKYAELMNMDYTHAKEFLTRIERLGVIYIRYTQQVEHFYSLRTEDEV
jgi:predicted transcriptional regulator